MRLQKLNLKVWDICSLLSIRSKIQLPKVFSAQLLHERDNTNSNWDVPLTALGLKKTLHEKSIFVIGFLRHVVSIDIEPSVFVAHALRGV